MTNPVDPNIPADPGPRPDVGTNPSANYDDTTGGVPHPTPTLRPDGTYERPENYTDAEWEAFQANLRTTRPDLGGNVTPPDVDLNLPDGSRI